MKTARASVPNGCFLGNMEDIVQLYIDVFHLISCMARYFFHQVDEYVQIAQVLCT